MRSALQSVARTCLLVCIVIFDVLTAAAALLLVLIWGGTL